jgi:hypothetical protein
LSAIPYSVMISSDGLCGRKALSSIAAP